ncbi:uncharacterized protein [Triticum aestivum]|uniref:uncharacterized protein n=1 Tax=Triticum aestivum TaxID=4565 RepID=UPI001D0092EA|nr:uncharacterized protein LOC123168636 [Triticum aestivum]
MPWDPLLRGVRQTCATRWPGVSMTVGLGRPLRPRAFAALVGLPPCCLLWREATPVPCSSFLRPSFCLSRFSLSTVLLLRSTRLHFLFASPRLADLLRRRRVHASGNGVCAFGRCCWLSPVSSPAVLRPSSHRSAVCIKVVRLLLRLRLLAAVLAVLLRSGVWITLSTACSKAIMAACT